MRRWVRLLAAVPPLLLTVTVPALPSDAGPDRIKFPAGWKCAACTRR